MLVNTTDKGKIAFGIFKEEIIDFLLKRLFIPWVVPRENKWTMIRPLKRYIIKSSPADLNEVKTAYRISSCINGSRTDHKNPKVVPVYLNFSSTIDR